MRKENAMKMPPQLAKQAGTHFTGYDVPREELPGILRGLAWRWPARAAAGVVRHVIDRPILLVPFTVGIALLAVASPLLVIGYVAASVPKAWRASLRRHVRYWSGVMKEDARERARVKALLEGQARRLSSPERDA
jgi:hypothetical protein